jgi:hypothetical protein
MPSAIEELKMPINQKMPMTLPGGVSDIKSFRSSKKLLIMYLDKIFTN